MPRLFELNQDGILIPGINNRDYTLKLGEDFINDPAPVFLFDSSFSYGRVLEATLKDHTFVPEEFQESRVIIHIRDQTSKLVGPWDLYHPDDPICEEPHSLMQPCVKCIDRGFTSYVQCAHYCRYCSGQLRVRPRRIHIYPVPYISRHYLKKVTRKHILRSGMEALIYLSPGETFYIIRYARAWYRYLHRKLEFDVEGRLRVSTFSDRDTANPQSVWL